MKLALLLQLPNCLGFVGMLVAGRKHRAGWAIALASEFAWATWGWQAHAWSIMPWCAIWGAVFVRNWWLWRPNEQVVAVTD